LKISVKPSEKYGMAEKQIFDMPILGGHQCRLFPTEMWGWNGNRRHCDAACSLDGYRVYARPSADEVQRAGCLPYRAMPCWTLSCLTAD